MAIQTINIGSAANDGTGDTLRSAFTKTNANFAEIGERNEPNGFVGIEANGSVLATFAHRRDTLANIADIVLAAGELAFTTDTKEVYLGDGVTTGGTWLYSQPRTFSFLGSSLTLVADATTAVQVTDLAVGSYMYEFMARFNHSGTGTSNFALQASPDDWTLNADPVPPGFAGGTSPVFQRAIWSDQTISNGFFAYNSGQSVPGRVTAPITETDLNDATVFANGGFVVNGSPNAFSIGYFKRLLFGADQSGVTLRLVGSLRRVA